MHAKGVAPSRLRSAQHRVAALALAGCALLSSSCLLPLRVASSVEGVIVDAKTHRPVPNAIVVVRFDGYYDEILPDRELLGHREGRTDELGRFEIGPMVRAGINAWPLLKTEARVVGVIKDGYRCPGTRAVRSDREARIQLTPALDVEDRRDSCRPVPARPGEAGAYMTAWRQLFPERAPEPNRDSDRQFQRQLAARSVLGYGENCEGPVLDMALSPGGERAALLTRGEGGPSVWNIDLSAGPARPAQRVADASEVEQRRLAWTSPWELVFWEPAARAQRAVSPSIFSTSRFEVVWEAPGAAHSPASLAPGARRAAPHMPLDPADLNDEGDAQWFGRSFELGRSLDATTGLPSDHLTLTEGDGSSRVLALPGEACGPRGRFGRPQYRISVDGRTALDLRFVEGGCHAVGIDLQSGEWAKLDASSAPATCRESRNVPASRLALALRGYSREVAEALQQAGADPSAAYVLRIHRKTRAARAEGRDYGGRAVSARVPDFPVATPLRRIDVSVVGVVTPSQKGPRPVPGPRPLPEPL